MTLITSADRHARLIDLIQADALFTANYPGKTVLSTDPDGIEEADVYSVSLEIAGDGIGDGSLGESGVGTDEPFTQVVLQVYVYSEATSAATKAQCVSITNTVAAIIRKFQSTSVQGAQLWHSQEFVKRAGGLCTTYHWQRDANHYVSVTPINLYARATRL